MIKTILFDMDNTLYPESSGMSEEMNRRINTFVSALLKVDYDTASTLRRENLPIHGTTMKWLMNTQDLQDEREYIEHIHPKEMDKYLNYSQDLITMLSNLPQRRAILTNAPEAHAERVISYLKLQESFEKIYDISYNNGRGKPHADTYEKVLKDMNIQPEETLLVDDFPVCLEGFSAMGGQVLLVDELNKYPALNYPKIKTIYELPAYLTTLKEALHV